jgi:hypothetical protein
MSLRLFIRRFWPYYLVSWTVLPLLVTVMMRNPDKPWLVGSLGVLVVIFSVVWVRAVMRRLNRYQNEEGSQP